ncbi:ABC transporter ATP-binding protein [Fusobacterium necrophorum]|uniref:ABC transporter n=2 Tax=Fusobacterium necrophorum TaxID=859 RepID=A0AB73BXG1_9FUSO|nr:ABC transporter ATP-binding protein [Fusobacterium necrophorum]AYZ73200.1 ABC transporter ATP-binding protein [Fusobacterium necrophorum]AZW08803.1 ABC transporter ATP-binding protein [Fusobacterium necrophorum subsp. necrophorum]KDE61812.1 ABC transporter [Fusobacterium necrophorum DJ-1]KDE64113.1 ABC transporter [Fusobacterium necrophorum BL]KDE71605.1 ABC transporter [Fusobacterium necrophorum DAB]
MIIKLSKSIREYKTVSLLTPLLVSLEVIMECILPSIIALLINQIKSEGEIRLLFRYSFFAFILLGFSFLAGILAGTTSAVASCGFAKNLRKDMFYHIQHYSFKNIEKFPVSSLITRMTSDISNLQNAYIVILRTAIRAPLMLIFSFIMVFILGAKLVWIFFVVVPILVIGLIWIIRKAFPFFQKIFIQYDAMNNLVQENIKSMRVVKSYVREEYEEKKFNLTIHKLYTDSVKVRSILAFTSPLMQFCIYAITVFLLFFASYHITLPQKGNFDIGQLSSLLLYSLMILNSFMALSMVFVMISMSVESGKRITEVLIEKSLLSNPENPIFSLKDNSIRFENVSFQYSKKSKKKILTNINLQINTGETIGIIGSTGSAKSSLVQLIPRLYDVTEGSIKVGGVDIRSYDITTLRKQIVIVLQKNTLFAGSIRENLRFGRENATEQEMKKACQLAQADEFISHFQEGYDSWIEQGGTNLSGGQKQRLCLARTFLKNPKILILDDATSAVDTKTDRLIQKALSDFFPESTKIIVAQRIASIEHADRIILMEHGHIQAIGTHQQLLLENQNYRDIYISQKRMEDRNED